MSAARELSDREFLRACPKAFVVSEPDEDRATVVWARNSVEARRLGHYQDDIGTSADETELHVRRAPEFDQLNPHLPFRIQQLQAGWWFECWHCERRINVDDFIEVEDEHAPDGGYEYPFEPVDDGRGIYCNGWCAAADAVGHVERRIRMWEAIERAVERFPTAVIHSYSDCWRGAGDRKRGMITFSVAELPYSLTWMVNEETINVPKMHEHLWGSYRRRVGRDWTKIPTFWTGSVT